MKINLLHILMLLVAMQSTMAVADLHQSHQTGQEHISFNHVDHSVSTQSNVQSNIQLSSETELNTMFSYDCQHCCHGVACHYYLLRDAVSFLLHLTTDNVLEDFNPFSTRIISPGLRPPIS